MTSRAKRGSCKPESTAGSKVSTGLDRLCSQNFASISKRRVALLANQATVDSQLRHAADLIAAAAPKALVKLFAPEHGFRGELQDMDSVGNSVDKQTGLPVISLYGSTADTLSPRAEDLEGVDLLLVDLPDIGSRYYTFAQTLAYSMKTAAEIGLEVMVLDRPNPIDGVTIEGGPLRKECRSFCGHAPLPVRHGLTLGEHARLFNHGFGDKTGRAEDALPAINCQLTVVEASGWQRQQYFDATGLPWVLPSPNMPTLDTAIIYPGSCLFEATEVSEARGTTKPLEMFGAPYIDAVRWKAEMSALDLDLRGAILRPTSFLPKFQKHSGAICHGLQLHIVDRTAFQPVRWGIALLFTLARLFPNEFSWRRQAFEFISETPAIDLLFGGPELREAIADSRLTAQSGLEKIFSQMESFESGFREHRGQFLLY